MCNDILMWRVVLTVISPIFTFMHLADAFIQSFLFRLYIFCQYVCFLGIEPTTFALLTQCSTTEPQEHLFVVHLHLILHKTTKLTWHIKMWLYYDMQ